MTSVQTFPGDLRLPILSRLYVDGMPLDNLIAHLKLNASWIARLREAQEQQFWSTPARANTDRTREVMEISLNSPQRINVISFSLAHFPHRAWVQYLDADGVWQTMKQSSGLFASVAVQESVPLVISSGVNSASKAHYQHFGAGHWVPYRIKVEPVTATRLRVVLARISANAAPINTLRQKVAYSLGVKEFSVGYEATNPSDVPVVTRSGDVPTESSVIASSTDILGSSVNYVVRANRAADLLAGRGQWKSGPQPIATAVVNLYVDARDSKGDPQIIEKFYLDPIHTGSTMNLYYSLDDPAPTRFRASETPLAFPMTRPFGALQPESTDSGIMFPTTTAFLDIDNKAVQFDPRRPFQLGMQVQPQFPSTDTGNSVIYDDGVLKIFFGPDPTGVMPDGVFQVSLGTILLSYPDLVFDFNARLRFVLQYDGTDLTLFTPVPETSEQDVNTLLTETELEDGSIVFKEVTISEPDDTPRFYSITSVSGDIPDDTQRPETLRIGGDITAAPEDAIPANARLLSLYIKTGNPDDVSDFAQFWTDPSGFVVTPEYPSGTLPTDNAILRYDPSQRTDGVESLNPYGFLGGPAVVYEAVNWTPIGRDYQLKKGFYDFDPTRARFFKLEFSNLIAEPYETDQPVVLTAKVFAQRTTTTSSIEKATATSSNTGGSGVQVNQDVSVVNRFEDQNLLTTSGSSATVTTNQTATYLPTEAQYVKDPQGAAMMSETAPYWNFTQHNPKPTMPRQSLSGQHYYETVTVETNKRVAYFVGLSKIVMYRQNRQISDDENQYLELFHDDQDLIYSEDVPNWSLGEGKIYTSSALGAPVTMTSKPLNTFRLVRGLQFATTQSVPKQLLLDSDFDDLSLQYWQPMGDAAIVPDPYFNTDVGSLVRITRAGAPVTWSSMEANGTWNQIEDLDPNPYRPTYDLVEGDISPASTGGIQSFQDLEISSVGKLYAAARILAPKDLTAPVRLQLLNGDGTVLAQESATASAGQIVEWSVEYNIGTGGVPEGTRLWTAVEALAADYDGMEAIGTWNDVAAGTPDRDIFDVKVQLFQDQATSDVWYVDNISIFNDPIMWEFSRDGGQTFWPVWDIRNDPHGVFLFPDGDQQQPTGGSAIVWRVTGAAPDLSISALQIRPWFDSVMMGMPEKFSVQKGGPNLTPLDQSPDVVDDPMFKVWHRAIPQDWYYIYRQWVRQNLSPSPVIQRSYLPDTVPEGVNEGSPAAPDTSIMPSSFVYTGS